MRTDAKVGFAIAGVLLAVLAVWAIVGTKKAATKRTSQVVSVVPDPTPQTNNTDPVTSSSGTPSTHVDTPPTTPMAGGDRIGILPGNNLGGMTDPGIPPHGENVTPPTPPHTDPAEPRTAPRVRSRRGSEHPGGDLADSHFTPVGTRKYTIKSGQTLSSIAYEVYGNSRFWVNIKRENSDIDPDHLKVNTVINLPDVTVVRPEPINVVRPLGQDIPDDRVETAADVETGRTYRVKQGDSLYRIAKNVLGSGRKAEALYDLNRDRIGGNKAALKVGTLLRLPAGVTGPVVLSDASR